MMTHEPKCILWKRQRVAALTANMSREQEIEFWRKKTEEMRARQQRQELKHIEGTHA